MTSITIAGVGANQTVQVEDDSTLQDALNAANVSPGRAGLQVEVNGSPVQDATTVSVSDGDQVVITPRAAKLG